MFNCYYYSFFNHTKEKNPGTFVHAGTLVSHVSATKVVQAERKSKKNHVFFMIIRKNTPNGLKGQKQLAQGSALGILEYKSFCALKGQKPLIIMLLPFQGESCVCVLFPGRCPGLGSYCPFGARKKSRGNFCG